MEKVIIIGAGIGGLCAAIALQKLGYEVNVYEKFEEVKKLGAGILLQPNTIKALRKIGIAEEVNNKGFLLNALEVKLFNGDKMADLSVQKQIEATGEGTRSFHRAELHEVLLNLLKEGTVHLGKECQQIEQTDKGVKVLFKDLTVTEGDILVGADGIHSIVRETVTSVSKIRYAGYTCWRSVVDVPQEVIDNLNGIVYESWGKGVRFGTVPLSNNRVYWFACKNASENDEKMKEVGRKELLEIFGNFHEPIKQVLELTQDDQILWNDIIDIKPLKRFHFGKIILLGDAAHAMTPNMGQGAGQSIEDAAVLMNCLEKEQEIQKAFEEYSTKRVKRTTMIVNQSELIGKVGQWENGLLIGLRNFVMKTFPQDGIKQMEKVYNVDF